MSTPPIDVVVFDVLGTLVDEPGGLRAAIELAAPGRDEGTLTELVGRWQAHVEREQRRIVTGDRPFAPSEVLDAEAAAVVAESAGITDPGVVATLAGAGQRHAPWPDSHAGLARLAARFPVVGLSNAGRTALLALTAYAGLRFHQAVSAQDAGTYKPAAAVYGLAVRLADRPPERLLMVAAHAWDLRGAQALGMRTAYVARPVGEPPAPGDRFDLHAEDLDDLADQLDRT